LEDIMSSDNPESTAAPRRDERPPLPDGWTPPFTHAQQNRHSVIISGSMAVLRLVTPESDRHAAREYVCAALNAYAAAPASAESVQEGERLASLYRESRDHQDHVEGTRESLERCAKMLNTYAPDCFPADDQGRIHFARAMMESTADEITKYLTTAAPAAASRCPDCGIPLSFHPHDHGDRTTPPTRERTNERRRNAMVKLDGKFHGVIVKNKDNTTVPQDQWIVFLAKDNALPATLSFYYDQCRDLGASMEQLEAVADLMNRVADWRKANPGQCKVPDVHHGEISS
jgi:ferredoxin